MANRYARTVGGNWTDNATWSTTSGGAADTVAPTASDDVFLDANSGNVTISATSVGKSLTCTGYTGTLTHNAGITITLSGSATFVSGMTYSIGSATTSILNFNATGTWTSGGKTMPWTTITGGTITLGSNIALGNTSIISLTSGTLDTSGSNFSINAGGITSTGSLARTINLNGSTVSVGGFTSQTLVFSGSNLTFNAGTSTINHGTTSTTDVFTGLSKTFSTVVFRGGSSISDSNTFENFTVTGNVDKTSFLSLAANQTVTGTLTINGNSSTNRVLIRSNTLGTARTITAAAVSISNADFRDITAAGAASWDLSAITGLSGDCGGNSGITFTTAVTNYWVGGTGSWSTSAEWASSSGGAADSGRVPLPQDNATFDANSFSAGSQTVTADMPRLGKDINWTGATNSPTWADSIAHTIYGSLTLISGMTFTFTDGTTFEGRSTHTLTSAGKSFTTTNVAMSMFGGTLSLSDAISVGTGLTVNNGTFTTNGFAFTGNGISSSNSNVRTFNLGSSTLTFQATSGNALNLGTSTNATMNAGTSTILLSDTGASSKTFAGGGKTYNDLKIAGGGAGAVIITGANTFNRIYTDGGGTKTITFPASTITTLSNTSLSDNFENGTNVITINSSSGGSAWTISKPVGRFVGDHLSIQDSTASGTFYAGSNSTNVSGNSGWIFSDFSPNQSGGLMAWLDALDGGDGTFVDRLTKAVYTNAGCTRGVRIASGTELIFDGTNDKLTLGNIGGIYAFSCWIKAGSDTEQFIDFNGTNFFQISGGTLAATAWTSPTIYVNGVATATMASGAWKHVAVTSSTAVTASAVVLGLIGADYGAFSITNIKIYDRQLTATDVGQQYNYDRTGQ